MFVCFHVKSNRTLYSYENVSLLDLTYHKFPSGRTRKCLNLVLENGTTVNFCFSEVSDLIVENCIDEVHPWNDDARILFVEDGQVYERS